MKIIDLFEIAELPTPAQTNAWAESIKLKYGLENFDLWQYPGGDLKLDTLVVPKGIRKEGLGTKVMEELIRYADAHGFRLILSVAVHDDRMGTTSRARLIRFYKRFGFVENKGRNKDFTVRASMIRKPKSIMNQKVS